MGCIFYSMVQPPEQEVQDRLYFLVNNLSEQNLSEKVTEVKTFLTTVCLCRESVGVVTVLVSASLAHPWLSLRVGKWPCAGGHHIQDERKRYFAYFMSVKRASIEHNFHRLWTVPSHCFLFSPCA